MEQAAALWYNAPCIVIVQGVIVLEVKALKRILFSIMTCAVVCALTCVSAGAAEITESSPGTEYSGYIVKMNGMLSEAAVIASSDAEDMERIMPGMYKTDDRDAALSLLESGDALYAEPNYIVRLPEEDPAGEPEYADIQASDGDELAPDWGYNLMKAKAANDAGLNGKGVRIGIIDTGLNTEGNTELEGVTVEKGQNYVDKKNPDDTTGKDGHGTAVAELMAAADDGIGVTGIARGASYIPLKCFNDDGSAYLSDIAEALGDAVDKYKCDIVNMSLSTNSDSKTLKSAIEYAYSKGVLLVAAAGNISSDVPSGTLLYPAYYSEVIGVGAITSDYKVSSSSQQTDAVYVCAPGKNVYTGSSYEHRSGTSFASPLVAATAALMIQESRNNDAGITNRKIMEELKIYSNQLGEGLYNKQFGYGLAETDRMIGHISVKMTEEKDDEGNNTITLNTVKTGEEKQKAAAAAYDADGRMLKMEVFELESSKDYTGENSLKIVLPENAKTVKSFLLDGNGVPTAEITELEIAQEPVDISKRKDVLK